ncbi:hypothetical protein EZS27_009216 [termite gut metagenome]|uniref:Uncharacterized protein n=1 Tax=termite gut metagenome TaxID=433724 RepID=A0A5J4SC97_9ZZZZ
MAYIPLIKTTQWIDLSLEHKKLRQNFEDDLSKACVAKEPTQPIMLQGAFGIGKTNTLYYLFHYGWCVLKTPVFFVSLDELTQTIKEYAEQQSTGKIQNSDLGNFINEILNEQIESLKESDWDNIIDKIYFPEVKGGNLNGYLADFKMVEVIEDSENTTSFASVFSESVIRDAILSGNRPILLIDEFESKFYELKKIVETSGGGVLRELFDQIVQDIDLFYLVIGNGPASGYEIAKERGDDTSESETAANRRLKTKSIPFPTVNLLQRSFLKGKQKGYINFIWWLSRCRPGHILKLKDILETPDEINGLSFSEIITKPIFKEPIDEGGEAVTYLKTDIFNDIDGRLYPLLSKMLFDFSPIEFEIKDFKLILKDYTEHFYCSAKKCNVENDLLPVLKNDLYASFLKKLQEEEKYTSINYIEHIQPYFSYILSGISDENGDMAFGMINDRNPDKVLSDSFIIPLIELTYDFISLYQDDSLKEIKETLDFLLLIISKINESNEKEGLEKFIPNVYDLFEKCRLPRIEKAYLQISLSLIRETIEQPIGSPQLKYKNETIASILSDSELHKRKIPLIFQKTEKLDIYFIPDLPDEILKNYCANLEKYLCDSFIEKIHEKGDRLTRVIYLADNEIIEDFKQDLLYYEDENKPEPAFVLKKIEMVKLDDYQLNFATQVHDYIDSISKIGIIGTENGDLSLASNQDNTLIINIEDIIEIIGKRPWTEKKETIRTIEHYRKLLFDGYNSIFLIILHTSCKEYKDVLAEKVCNENDYRQNISDYRYFEKILKDETEAYDKYSGQIALLYLIENSKIDDNLKKLLDIAAREYHFVPDEKNAQKGINFAHILKILTKDKENLERHTEVFDLSSEFVGNLYKFVQSFLRDSIANIADSYDFIKKTTTNTHFIETYHQALGSSLHSELIQALYNLSYINTLDKESEITNVKDKITQIGDSLTEIRTKIIEKLNEIKDILNGNETFSSYPQKLQQALTGIVKAKQILDNASSFSTLLIVNSICEHFDEILDNSQLFFKQINTIYSSLQSQKGNVDRYQDEIDEMYQHPLTETLLNFEYQTKRSDNYLWKRFFLLNLKNESEYGLFEVKFNPFDFEKPYIYDDKLKRMVQKLVDIFQKLKPDFEVLLENICNIHNEAEETIKLREYVTELLNISEE